MSDLAECIVVDRDALRYHSFKELIEWVENNTEYFYWEPILSGYNRGLMGLYLSKEDMVAFRLKFGV